MISRFRGRGAGAGHRRNSNGETTERGGWGRRHPGAEKMKSIDAGALRPSTSDNGAGGDVGHTAGEEMSRLRERFDRHLPKYGSLWRSMAGVRPASAAGKENAAPGVSRGKDRPREDPGANRDAEGATAVGSDAGSDASGPGLLGAILGGRAVSLRVGRGEGCGGCATGCDWGCDCADPIVELVDDEDASAHDGGELADTDDECDAAGMGGARASGGGRGAAVPADAPVEIPDVSDDDDESVVIVRRTPKRRMYVIESDEDSDSETIGSDDSDDGSRDGDDEANGSFVACDEEDAKALSETPKPKMCYLIESNYESGVETMASETGGSSGVYEEDSDAESLSIEDGGGGELGRREKGSGGGSGSVTGGSSDRCTAHEKGGRQSQARIDAVRSNACEGSESSSEEEWVELSSDEEDGGEAPPPMLENTVVILSSDDEEESDDDNRSVFTVSDDEDESNVSVHPRAGAGALLGGCGSPTGRRPSRPTGGRPAPEKNAKPSSQRGRATAKSFRRERDALLSRTFSEFDRRAFDGALSAVEVTWSNRLNTTAGITRMRGRTGGDGTPHERTARIELATKVIDDEDRLRSTLLHEMCHAAQWLVDGTHKPPHGKCFKKWAAISMRKIRDVEVTTTHDYQIAYKYAWACTTPKCSVVVKRHSRSVDPARQCCGRCKGRLVEIDVPGRDAPAGAGYTPKVRREASGFALFVKEHSSRVRGELAMRRSCATGEVTQADVMRECGRLWRIQKTGGSSSSSTEGGGGQSKGDNGLESMADRLVELTLNGGGSL